MYKLKQLWDWFDDRSGITDLVKPMAQHLVPKNATWAYVFGSATLFCFLLQIATGVGLSLIYQASSETAYDSLKYITDQALLGSWLRGIHYFGASGMILLMGIHMMRVYIMAAYKFPRELQWITGILLLLLTISMGFTGQLLRWDDTGVWSAVVAAEQMGRIPIVGKAIAYFLIGGQSIGGNTLSRFYSYHVFILPAMLILFTGFHVYLVFKNGISEPPILGKKLNQKKYRKWYHKMLKEKGVPFFPDAAWRDIVFGVIVISIILLLAFIKGAPKLVGPPDLTNIYDNPKPDWYLSWIFALFALMPPKIENFVIATMPFILIFLLFALPFFSNKGERHPLRRPWAIIGVFLTVAIITSLSIEGAKSPWSPDFKVKALEVQDNVKLSPSIVSGISLFHKKGCLYCHNINGHGGQRGPDLSKVEKRLSKEEIIIRIVNGGGNMPAYGGSLNHTELEELVNFLTLEQKNLFIKN